jgi:broad specificity phosphatase PhoE
LLDHSFGFVDTVQQNSGMRLVLIRHAESEHAVNNIVGGPRGCRGVTPRGREQAGRLADRLRRTGELADCAVLLTSPWPRARQTAEILRPALPATAVTEDPNLCELLPGQADGLTWDAYRAQYGMFDLPAEPERPFAPGGESWLEFHGRVRRTMAGLAEQFAGQTVAAVTHSGFIVVSLLALFDIPRPGTGARFDVDYTSLATWRMAGSAWQLERYNDTWHLNRTGETVTFAGNRESPKSAG